MRYFHFNFSLKWQIQLWYGLILAVVVITLGVFFYKYERSIRLNELDHTFQQEIHPLSEATKPKKELKARKVRHRKPLGSHVELTLPGGWESVNSVGLKSAGKKQDLHDTFGNFEGRYVPAGYYAVVWETKSNKLLYRSSNAPSGTHPDIVYRGYWRRTVKNVRRELYHATPHAAVLIGRDMTSFEESMQELRLKLIGIGAGVITLGVFVGWLFISTALKPIQRIRSAAAAIAKGNLKERILRRNTGKKNEISQLTDDLNRSFEQLEQLFQRQRQFTADAAHELRTPLTALITHIQLGQNKRRSAEDYEEILEVSSRSADRLKRIVDDLVEVFRYDSGSIVPDIESLPALVLLETLGEDLRPMIEAKGSSLRWESFDGVINCDPFRIEQVITNLINNAIQHNPHPVELVLKSYKQGGSVIIEVQDNGDGIQPENLEYLFDRFYQEDDSHSSGGNNIGMGLAISKVIVEAHGGTLTVTSEPKVKTTFTISIPQ